LEDFCIFSSCSPLGKSNRAITRGRFLFTRISPYFRLAMTAPRTWPLDRLPVPVAGTDRL